MTESKSIKKLTGIPASVCGSPSHGERNDYVHDTTIT